MPFLDGQQIFVWDEEVTRRLLAKIFGNGVEFNMLDLRPEIAKIIPSVSGKSLLALKDMSKIALYSDEPATEIDGFYNLFVTYIQRRNSLRFSQDLKNEESSYAD